MALRRIAFFGDVVGAPGRRAFGAGAKRAREDMGAELVIVNGENTRHGSGLHPDGYRALRRDGADAITLGDHWLRHAPIFPILEDPAEPLSRPANLAEAAPGKRTVRVDLPADDARPIPLHIVTVLGRLFMPIPANDPFATVDEVAARAQEEDPRAMVIVEVHAEATSEKIAMTWHCAKRWPGRVVGVVGTHTHVQTSDARIVDHCLGAITDLGMCAGHRGVIGRQVDPVLQFMTEQRPASFDVADADLRAHGLMLVVDDSRRLAVEAQAISMSVAS